MSDCLHCDIHELLESNLQSEEANLADIAAKVTEVLADLILNSRLLLNEARLWLTSSRTVGGFIRTKR